VAVTESRVRVLTLVATSISSFVTPFMSSSINIALPAIGKDLGLDAITLGWLPTAALLSSAILLLPFGRLADIYHRRMIFNLGLGTYTLASLGAALAPSGTLLLICRLLQGIAGAMIFATGIAILTAVYPRERRGWALGINTAVTYLGLSLGPFLGGIITRYLGWRMVFGINLPFSLAALLMSPAIPGSAPTRVQAFDLTGSIIYAAGILGLLFGLTRIPDRTAIILTIAGIICLLAFLFWERRTTSPLLNLQLLRTSRTFTFSNLAALINYAATAAVGFLLSLYLQYLRQIDVQTAGLILVCQPVVMALFSPLTGRLADRHEPRLLASVGMGLTTLGLGLFALLSPDTPLWFIISALLLLGFGFALFSAPNTSAVMGALAPADYSIGSAILATMRLLGQSLSLGLAMMLLGIFVGPVRLQPGSAPGLLPALRLGFVIFSLLCFLGIFASLARGRQEDRRTANAA